MDQSNQPHSLNDAFYNLYSSSLGLVEQEQQFDDSLQRLIYQGMSVQEVSPFPVYNSGPETYQSEADHSNSLNEYNIESLINFDLENAYETAIQELPQSILDEYVPYQSDNEPVNDVLSPITPCIQQLLSRDEPEIREQIPANHTSPDIQSTNPTAGIHSSQDLRAVAVVNPLCMHQATSDNQATQAEVNVDGSSSLAERQRERQRERKRERKKERQRELRKDPAFAERERERQRERRKDPAFAERKRERKRERYQTDPAYAERLRKRQRELRKDPAFAERERERQRERYQTDPAFAERERERKRECQRERYQTDPAFAEGQKIYKNTYRRIKKETSNKEEAKKQAVIARNQYLQSVYSAKNSGDLPLTSNLAETTQSSSKNLDGAAPPAFQSSS